MAAFDAVFNDEGVMTVKTGIRLMPAVSAHGSSLGGILLISTVVRPRLPPS
jgi:hypothetical protein